MTTTSAIDPPVHAAVAHFGRLALAWEVLRRDPEYRAAFSGVKHRSSLDISADPAFVARWGLHFP